MELKQLQLIHKVLDDYADVVFNDKDDYSEEVVKMANYAKNFGCSKK